MAKAKRVEHPQEQVPGRESAERILLRRTRFDVILRLLTLAAFLAFSVLAVWNLQMIRDAIERQDRNRTESVFWRLAQPGSEPADRKEAFLRLVAAGNREWRSANLNDLDFEDTTLDGVVLKNAVFDSCRFHKVHMYETKMSPGSFRLCRFTDADMIAIDLREAIVFKSTFLNCNLRQAQLTKASLEQSTLKNVDLSLADMAEAFLLLTRFEQCNLKGANLTDSTLTNARFIGTDLRGARLPGALFRDTDFTDSNWWRARGLPRILLDDCKRRYPPSKNAKQEFREDYAKWLKEIAGPEPKLPTPSKPGGK